MLCFLHAHSRVLQSAMQLHLITRSRSWGAGARYVSSGTTPTLSDEVHQQIPSILGLADTHEYCGTLLLLMLVVALVDETCSMRPSHRTVDAEGSSDCQSSLHYVVPPMLSLLQCHIVLGS